MRLRLLIAVAFLAVLVSLVLQLPGSDDTSSEVGASATTAPMTGATTPAPPAAGPADGGTPPATAPPDLSSAGVELVRVAEFTEATALATRPDDPARYVADRAGLVHVVRPDGAVDPEPLLDLSGEVSLDGERGLLGLAFSPDGSRLYAHFTGEDGDNVVAEWRMADGGADEGSRRELLRVPHPFPRHHGGDIHFGPDGMLYVALGDGEDRGAPKGNAGNPGVLLGKILRIDPAPAGDRPYTVPADNPFVGQEGAAPEVWVMGVRNPWRFSFDRETGDVWIGDVGQWQREEITRLPAGAAAGAHLGWPWLEGDRDTGRAGAPDGLVPPLLAYPHDGERCAITGGYVYRGTAVPELRGAYVFADLCDGKVRGLTAEGATVTLERELGPAIERPAALGEGADGELYVFSMPAGMFLVAPA